MPSKINKIIKSKNTCFVFKKTDKSAVKFEKYITIILEQLFEYYKIKNPKINIELIYSRKELDNKLNCRTPRWLVAAALKNSIYLFSPAVIENLSDHKKMEIKKLLTHELCHIFNSEINKTSLMWIDEGAALFLANQRKDKDFTKKELNFFANNFFSENIDLRLFAKNNGYRISYWIIKKIVGKYNKKKILELLKINPEIKKCKKELEKIIGSPIEKFLK
jgi:hypothetical protein